jgi:hypothetical protein
VVETEPHIVAWPNPYEDPRCQATDSPSKRILPIVSAGVQAERRAPLAMCAGCMAVDRCPKAATPHTYGGALARQHARAAGRAVTRCGLATSPSPPTGLFHSRAARRTSPVRHRRGCGAATFARGLTRPLARGGASVHATAAGSGRPGRQAPPRSTTPCHNMPAPRAKAAPIEGP